MRQTCIQQWRKVIFRQWCVNHTLQLVINDALNAQSGVVSALAICRSAVGAFKHSAKAVASLRLYQEAESLPTHAL